MLEKLSKFAEIKYQKLNKKLSNLLNNEHVDIPKRDNFQFHEPVKNLSNCQFTNEELKLISIGYKSNISKKDNLEKLIIDSEHIIQNNQVQDKEALRYQISQEIIKSKNQQFNKKSNNYFFKKTI